MRVFEWCSANAVNRQLGRSGAPLWQRGYYYRVMRNEREYAAIATCIHDNAAQWECDRDNPRLEDQAQGA